MLTVNSNRVCSFCKNVLGCLLVKTKKWSNVRVKTCHLHVQTTLKVRLVFCHAYLCDQRLSGVVIDFDRKYVH